MLDRLFGPFHGLHHWLDNRPDVRIALGALLFAGVLLLPLPGGVLDAWLLVVLATAIALSTLVFWVGEDLAPGEAMQSLPGFMRRFLLHRVVLSLAITKAILLGQGTGHVLEWVARSALGSQVGLGLATVTCLLLVRFALSHFPFQERLELAQRHYSDARAGLEVASSRGRLTPRQRERAEEALRQELNLLTDGAQVFRLLRSEAWLGLAQSVALLAVGGVAGLLLKGWSLSLTLSALTLYALAEMVVTLAPATLFAASLHHWISNALEQAVRLRLESNTEAPTPAPTVVVLELGREAHQTLRRAVPESLALVRARLAREFGVPLRRIDWQASSQLSARGFRIVVRGLTWSSGELDAQAGARDLGDLVWNCLRGRLGDLLTLESCEAWLDELAESHPLTVATLRKRLSGALIFSTLQALWQEEVPLRDVPGVLEAIVTSAEEDAGAPLLVGVRRRLSVAISLGLADAEGTITAWQLGGDWEPTLEGLDQDLVAGRDLLAACEAALGTARRGGRRMALIVPASHRERVAAVLRPKLPDVAVVSPEELSPLYGLRLLGTLERRSPQPISVSPLSLLKLTGA
ncbi:MAG: FHIPEP family type III secretion protein [Candidatus Sericytochromatia bacterium]|nr:FHIPEP family type III secretion protein [Candidatus Sericytochromatia bacterium]